MGAVNRAVSHLIEAGRTDIAAAALDALSGIPEPPPWIAACRARIAGKRGDAAGEEAAWRACLLLHPSYPGAITALARLVNRQGRAREAVSLWREAFERCSEQAQPAWYADFIASLKAAGEVGAATDALAAMVARFADDPKTLELQAREAAEHERWAAALALLERLIATAPAPVNPAWLDQKAMALVRVWRVSDGLQIWRDLIARNPEYMAAPIRLGQVALEFGMWEEALAAYSVLIRDFADRLRPEWMMEAGNCLLNLGRHAELPAAIAELRGRFPHASQGDSLALNHVQRLNDGIATLAPAVDAALERFPRHRVFIAEKVLLLLADGAFEAAEAGVRQLEAGAIDDLAVVSRWRLLRERDGPDRFRAVAEQAVADGSLAALPAATLAHELVRLLSPWAVALAARLLDAAIECQPNRVALICLRARCHVMLRQEADALRLIARLPPECLLADASELRAWAAAQAGDERMARAYWVRAVEASFFGAIHTPEPRLECVAEAKRRAGRAPVTGLILARNEMTMLPACLEHHRALGVERFVVIDNLSDDGSTEFLARQDDVTVYRAHGPWFATGCGMRWVNVLMARHAADGWCLYADADEMLVYPGCETLKLPDLVAYLEREGAEGMAGFMLDLFSPQLFELDGSPVPLAAHRWYDDDYEWSGSVRPPYMQPVGGIRARLFDSRLYLHKVPLLRVGSGVYLHSHETTTVRMASVSGAFLHYKMFNLALRHASSPAMQSNGNSVPNAAVDMKRQYNRYSAQIPALVGIDLRRDGVSVELSDSMDLLDRGLLRASPDFLGLIG